MRELLYCLCVMVGLLFVSCTEEPSQIGSEFFDGGSLNMSEVDTISVETSTITFDSLATSDATRLLVGSNNDEALGVLSSTAFFQVGIAEAFSIDKEFTSFTRAELRLVHDGYSYYDTLTPISFRVHELTEQIDFAINDSYLYNTSSFDYHPTPMGSVTYKPRPNTKDTVTVLLPVAFGRDIIRLAQASAEEVSTSAEFLNYFYGFAIVPSGNGPVVGFGTAAEVRIYYTDKSQTPGVERYLTLRSGDFLHFNRIVADRSATDLNGLVSQRDSYNSDRTGGQSYVQAGAGLGLRVSIPYLKNILIDNPGINIVNAVLEISPTRENEGNNITLPPKLLMTYVNFRNQLIQSYSEGATLVEDHYLGRDTHYSVDITEFVKQQLALQEFNDNALAFATDETSFRYSVDRLYIGDQLNDRPMKLILTCLTYSK